MPEQHDPIDELARFGAGLGSATPGGDMPLTAADVRRRGDRLRRRRTALVAGGAALAVAAVAVPVFAIVGKGDPRSDQDNIANEDHPALVEADLLRPADTEYEQGRKGAFRAGETFEGDGQAVYLRCQQEAMSALGAEDSFTRTFNYVPDLQPGDTPPKDLTSNDLVQGIAEFDSPAAARAAYDRFAAWTRDCRIPEADRVNVEAEPRQVDVTRGEAVIYDINWTPSPEPDAGYIGEFGLVLQDDRIAVVQLTVIGQDYNWGGDLGPSPLSRMLPTVAERLRPGVTSDDRATPTPPAATETAAGPVDPAIPDDFPLTADWPKEASDGDGIKAPSRDADALSFEACGTTLPDAPHEARLTTSYSNAEDYRTRQLTTYADADEAVAAVRAIRELYAGCPVGPKRDDGYTPNWAVRDTTVGGESFVVLGWDEMDGQPTPYGDTTLVVRVGSAVLVVVHAGESGAPSGGDDQRAIDQITAESATVIGRMCAWTVAGC